MGGPFKVVESFANGTYQLTDLDGRLHASRVNGLRLKKYHARLMIMSKDEMPGDEIEPEEAMAVIDGGSLTRLFAAADHE